MKHYLDLVSISEKVHRKRNRMSTFCIILAVLLVTAIFGMADMFVRSQIMKAEGEGGKWHIAVSDLNEEEIKELSARPNVQTVSFYDVLNYTGNQAYTLNGTNALVAGSDASFATQIFPNMIEEGKFPKSDQEVLLSLNAKDLLELDIGDQIEILTPNGNSYTYRISGFLENSANIMSEDSYVVLMSQKNFQRFFEKEVRQEATTNGGNRIYVQFKNIKDIQAEIADIKLQFNLQSEQISENTKLLGLMGQSTSSLMLQVYVAAAVLFVLVLSAAIMMITSSLNSNVAQRIEFFGLMRCIGATHKQVKRFVRKEALRWCRFAIPIGVGIGIAITWILCIVLRGLSPIYFGEMPIFNISIPSIASGILIGVLTVLLAAKSPAKRAAKVSPLAAVSGNANDLQPVKKALNIQLFKIDTALGIHHAKASRKNFILTTISFAFSIILFLAFSVAISFMNHTLTPLYPWTADISIMSKDKTCSVNHEYINELEQNSCVKAAYGRMFMYDIPTMPNDSQKKIDLFSYEKRQFDWSKEYLQAGSIERVQTEINTGLIVYEPQNTIKVGDTVTLYIEGKPQEIEIVGMLSTSPFNNEAGVGTIICSEDTFHRVTGQNDYTIIDIQLEDHTTDAEVNALHRTYGEGYVFQDERMDNSSTIGVYYCVWLFLYGFLVLIALITIFNVINSIALSVSARTKQYGIFRAIGLSTKELSKMVSSEAWTYTLSGSIVGTILGLIVHHTLFGILISYNWGDEWTIPWTELCVIIIILVLSVVFAVRGPIRKLRDMSIVDTIVSQ